MDRGSREVTIAGETRRLAPGELVFFQPGEPHACRPVGEERLDWRGLHVPQEVMERAAEAVTGRRFAPPISRPRVLPGSELTSLFREVWELAAGEQGVAPPGGGLSPAGGPPAGAMRRLSPAAGGGSA